MTLPRLGSPTVVTQRAYLNGEIIETEFVYASQWDMLPTEGQWIILTITSIILVGLVAGIVVTT